MRLTSVLLGLAYLAGHAITAFLLIFWATFPFENQSPQEAEDDDWLIGLGLGVLLVGLVVMLCIVIAPRWAAVAYAVAATAGGVLLGWALTVSAHGDGRLLAWGIGVELVGLAAVASGWRVRGPRLS